MVVDDELLTASKDRKTRWYVNYIMYDYDDH
jgi:hypothetical protein